MLNNKLNQISISGYKSIKKLDLELAPINVLIGANGSGKSNFLSFFKLLRWMIQSPGKLKIFVGRSGGASSLLFQGPKQTTQLEAELCYETESGKNDYAFTLGYAPSKDEFIFLEEKYRFSRNTFDSYADWKRLESGHKEAELLAEVALGDPTARTIQKLIQRTAVHQFHDTSETARIRQKWDKDDNRYLREDGANLAPFLLRLKENEPLYYKRIVDAITVVAPFFGDFELEPLYNSVLLQWTEKDSDFLFSSHQASDGMLRAMALITLLLQPPKQLPDVLILDEPELGLHPYVINIIGGLIQSVSHHTQVILATQSTLLVNCFEPEDVIVVERRNRQSYFSRLNPLEFQEWLEEYSLSELWEKNVLGGKPSR
jgi:predicted ATPase